MDVLENNQLPYDAIIVSPNSAVDSYYLLEDYTWGDVNRAVTVHHTAGGKGNNMARAMVMLGGRALSLSIIGGQTGQFIAQEMSREGIPYDFINIDQETRRSVTILVKNTPETTVILEPGLPLGESTQEQFIQHVLKYSEQAPYMSLVGSLPPDFPQDYYAKIVQIFKSQSIKICLDCSGDALRLAAEAGPFLIKVNLSEFNQAFGLVRDHMDLTGIQAVFRDLIECGVQILIVTNGSGGAYIYSRDLPPFHVVSNTDRWVCTAGAGDSFLAGMILALRHSESLKQAACFASASAAAKLQQVVCGFLLIEDVEGFLNQTSIHPV